MKKLKTAIVASVIALTTLIPGTAVQASTQTLATQATITTCASSGWDNWYSFFGPNWGSGTWCGTPEDGYWRTASQDGGTDGKCVSIWSNNSLTNNTTFKYVSGTLVCGYGYIGKSSIKTVTTHRLRVVLTNNTASTWYASYEFYNSTR